MLGEELLRWSILEDTIAGEPDEDGETDTMSLESNGVTLPYLSLWLIAWTSPVRHDGGDDKEDSAELSGCNLGILR